MLRIPGTASPGPGRRRRPTATRSAAPPCWRRSGSWRRWTPSGCRQEPAVGRDREVLAARAVLHLTAWPLAFVPPSRQRLSEVSTIWPAGGFGRRQRLHGHDVEVGGAGDRAVLRRHRDVEGAWRAWQRAGDLAVRRVAIALMRQPGRQAGSAPGQRGRVPVSRPVIFRARAELGAASWVPGSTRLTRCAVSVNAPVPFGVPRPVGPS